MLRLKSLRLPLSLILGTCWFLILPLQAWAATAYNAKEFVPQPIAMPNMFWVFIKMVFSLVLIAGLAYLMVRILKKNLQQPSVGQWVNIIDQYPLGHNKGVFLAEIAGKAYILGVTDHNINILGEFEDQERLNEIKRQAEARDQLPPAAQNLWTAFINLINKSTRKTPGDFHTHILKQIQRLQNISKGPSDTQRKDVESND